VTLREKLQAIDLPFPAALSDRIDHAARWKTPAIIVVLSQLVTGWLMIPAMEEPLRKIYDRSFGSGVGAVMAASVMKSIIAASIIVETGFIALRWLIIASMLYFLSRFVVGTAGTTFRRLLTIVAWCEMVFVLMNVLNLAVVYARGIGRIVSSADLTPVHKGLELFFDAHSNPSLLVLLRNVNIFSLLYVAVLSVGFGIATKATRGEAIGFVSLAWLVWMLVCVSRPFIEEICLKAIS